MEATLHTMRQLTALGRWVCLVLLIAYACSGIRTVGPQQSALVLRLGQLQPQVHGAGLLLTLPAPLDEVILYDTGAEHTLALDSWMARGPRVEKADQIKQVSDEEIRDYMRINGGKMPLPEIVQVEGNNLDPVYDGYTITGDWNIAQGRFALRYRIADPAALYRRQADLAPLLTGLCYRALTVALSDRNIDRVLTDEREKFAAEVLAEISGQTQALGLGIAASAFEIRELAPPRQVIAAFEEVTSAKLYAKTLIENSQELRDKGITMTKGQAAAIRQRAAAYANQLTASATGEAQAFTQFVTEYRKSPALGRHRLYTETMGYIMREVHSATLLPPGTTPPNFIVEPAPDNTR